MLSVIICTYNRAELLKECLKTLFVQTLSTKKYEVLVIDNNCTDHTHQIVKALQVNNSNLRYIQESKVGLSHARNRGAKEAKSNKLLYLDDDILAQENTFEKTLQTFNENHWAAFGGVYTQWFYYGRPKWFPKSWNTNVNDWKTYSKLPDGKYATGCVFAIDKKALNEIEGFDPNYGMTGTKIGYGEETDVQMKLRNKGYVIGFNPHILIKHVVPKHKLKIGWHLRAAWVNQTAAVNIHKKTDYPFWLTLKRIAVALIKRLKFLKSLGKKNYYWQNFMFDYSEPIIRLCASFCVLYLKRKNKQLSQD